MSVVRITLLANESDSIYARYSNSHDELSHLDIHLSDMRISLMSLAYSTGDNFFNKDQELSRLQYNMLELEEDMGFYEEHLQQINSQARMKIMNDFTDIYRNTYLPAVQDIIRMVETNDLSQLERALEIASVSGAMASENIQLLLDYSSEQMIDFNYRL